MTDEGKGTVRRLFPGGNTCRGFFSYYDYVWRPLTNPTPARVWIIKGGPGTGKSVMMGRIAEEMTDRGYDIELHHCSADPDSVDAVVIPALGAAVVDGTAPHTIEPAWPGAVDEIVNLGDDWDGAALRSERARIQEQTARYKAYYAAAYKYLAAAGTVHDEWRAAHAEAQDWGRVYEVLWGLLADLLRGRSGSGPGFVRKLFGSAITPVGPRHHLDTVATRLSRRIILAGPPGTGKSTVVAKVAAALAEHGVSLELLHCALRPEEPEHIIVPELDLAILTSEEPHPLAERFAAAPGADEAAVRTEVIDFGRMQRVDAARRLRDRTQTARDAFWGLFRLAEEWLRRASELHDELEALYAPHMDFDKVEKRRRDIVEQIVSLPPAVTTLPGR